MIGYYKKAIDDLDSEISKLIINQDNSLTFYETAIKLILKKILQLKKHVLIKGFKSQKEEIYSFKHIKPSFISKIICYNSIYKIEATKTQSTNSIKNHLNDELKKLKRYFDENLEFYKYYRTGSTYLDEKYFLRGKYDINSGIDTHYLVADPAFSTSHDYMVARIMANDMLQVYLEIQLHQNHQRNDLNNTTLNWTGNKTDLTELIYALHAQGVFNNGNADIKLIAKTLENIFNIDIGDFYHTFMELKSRKINYTKFLDKLHDALIRKMEERER